MVDPGLRVDPLVRAPRADEPEPVVADLGLGIAVIPCEARAYARIGPARRHERARGEEEVGLAPESEERRPARIGVHHMQGTLADRVGQEVCDRYRRAVAEVGILQRETSDVGLEFARDGTRSVWVSLN